MLNPITLPEFPTPAEPLSIWLLTGGVSPEHEVSLSSAETVLQHFAPGRLRVRPVCIRRDGRWCLAPEPLPAPLSKGQIAELHAQFTAQSPSLACVSTAEGLAELERERPALAFILMHGPQGEDGRVQALLEGVGINYIGSGVIASAVAMDKRHTQRLLRSLGLPVPRFEVMAGDQWQGDREGCLASLRGACLDRCVVKPVAGGSSVGVSIVLRAEDLPKAIDSAFVHDPEAVLCEEFVEGTEVTCGVVEIPTPEGIRTEPLAPTEILPRDGSFFDYHCKYTPGATEEITPARISAALTEEIQQLSLEVHLAVAARGFSRADFIVRDGKPLILEINTIPGMTPTSLLPQGAAARGIDFPGLLTLLVEAALARPVSAPSRPERS